MDLTRDEFAKKLSDKLSEYTNRMDEMLRVVPSTIFKDIEDSFPGVYKTGVIHSVNCSELKHEDLSWAYELIIYHPCGFADTLSAMPKISCLVPSFVENMQQSSVQYELWGVSDRNIFGEKWKTLAELCEEKYLHLFMHDLMETTSAIFCLLEQHITYCIRKECGNGGLYIFGEAINLLKERREIATREYKFNNFAGAVLTTSRAFTNRLRLVSDDLLKTKSFTKSKFIAGIRGQLNAVISDMEKFMASNNPYLK